MASRKTFAALISRKVGALGVDPGQLKVEDFVDPAVRLYERVRPRIVTKDVAGTGVQRYATPGEWSVGLSEVLSVEFPVDQDPPLYLNRAEFEPDDVSVLDVADSGNPAVPTQKILFHTEAPGNGTSFRLRFSAPHAVDQNGSTVVARDEEAVGNYGAHLFCLELMTRFMAARGAADVAAEIALAQAEKIDAIRRAADAFLEAADRLCGVTTGEGGTRRPVMATVLDADLAPGPEGFQTHDPVDM